MKDNTKIKKIKDKQWLTREYNRLNETNPTKGVTRHVKISLIGYE